MTCDSREHAIREMAYAMWEQAGRPSGDGLDFWLQAEKSVQTISSAEKASDIQTSKSPSLTSFRAVDPPPLKIEKASGQSRKKAG